MHLPRRGLCERGVWRLIIAAPTLRRARRFSSAGSSCRRTQRCAPVTSRHSGPPCLTCGGWASTIADQSLARGAGGCSTARGCASAARSQPRRHFQIIPLDAFPSAGGGDGAGGGRRPPIEALIAAELARRGGCVPTLPAPRRARCHVHLADVCGACDRTVDAGCVLTLPEFSFRHALCVLGDGILGMPTSEAGGVHLCVRACVCVCVRACVCLQACVPACMYGRAHDGGATVEARSSRARPRAADVLLARLHAPIASAGVDLARDPGASFNVLLTPAWMLVAPRSADAWNGVFVNALGFAGYILVRPGDGAARLTEQTPLGVLEAVGVALAGRAPLGDGGSLGGAAPAT